MAKSNNQSNVNKGKVERAFALVLDFSVEEIELLIGKLKGRKNQLNKDFGNKGVNRDTIST